MTPPSPPAPQPDVEKQRDRLITVRTAVLAALATVVASVISGVGASIVTSNMQAHAATQQFLRTQRQALYSTMLADEADFYVRMFDFEHWLDGQFEPVSAGAFTARVAAVDKAQAAFYKDYASVALVGSDATVEAAKVLVNAENGLYNDALISDYYACIKGHKVVPVCSTHFSDAEDRDKAITDARQAFSDAAKNDIQR